MKNLKIISWALIACALIIGLYTRILTFDNFVTFGLDQIRDAEVYAKMKLGEWPALGPIAPLNDNLGFHLFPLYHYLVGIFVLGTDNLNFQLLINGVFSFLSIPLFILLNYKLLENIKDGYRLLLASIGGLWLSILVSDIVNTNLAWNPSPMLFFVFLYFLTLDKINKIHLEISFIEHYLLWITLGISTAFLISLHTWSMVAFIPLFLFNCTYFCLVYFRKKGARKIIYPLIGLAYIIMLLSTYLISEMTTDWENTQNMMKVVTQTSTGPGTPFLVMLSRPFINFLLMVEKSFLVEPDMYLFGLPFIVILICFTAFNFKGNRFLFTNILISIFIYSIGIIFYSGEIKTRYQILILYLPILLTLSSLAYTPKNIFLKTFQIFYSLLFVLISIYFNWLYTVNFLSRVYGSTKLIDSDELVGILEALPEEVSICYPWGAGYDYLPQLQFLDRYITQKDFKFENVCVNSDYYIYLKNLPNTNSDYGTRPNIRKVYTNNEAILEGHSFTVYKLEEKN